MIHCLQTKDVTIKIRNQVIYENQAHETFNVSQPMSLPSLCVGKENSRGKVMEKP